MPLDMLGTGVPADLDASPALAWRSGRRSA
jgi:hypothetical protein